MAAFPTSSIEPDYGAAMPCPYLGLRDDPVTHFAWDNPEHHCHRVDPPQAIRINHQQGYCLSGRFETCAVRNDLNPSPSPSKYRAVFEGGASPFHLRLPHFSLPGFALGSSKQHGEAAQEQPRRVWPIVLAGLLVPLIIILVWAIAINSSGGGDNQASASGGNPLAETMPAVVVIADTLAPSTPTASSTPAPISTATLPPSSTPTATSDFAATQTVLALTPTPTASPTQPLFGCDDSRAYTFNLVEGPILSPEPGYIYNSGEAPPVVTASWILENTGSCQWTSILLLSATSGRLLVPILYVDDVLFIPDADSGSVIAGPGERVQVTLSFSPDIASSIEAEWVVVVDDFTLEEEPHLILDVVNWIIRIQPTATIRPTSRPGTSPTQPPGVTPPSDRPTPTQPSIRP
jgi:hypothetical protein